MDLFEIASKYHNVLEKAEKGAYSNGFRSFNIPKQDKPLFPCKEKYAMYLIF